MTAPRHDKLDKDKIESQCSLEQAMARLMVSSKQHWTCVNMWRLLLSGDILYPRVSVCPIKVTETLGQQTNNASNPSDDGSVNCALLTTPESPSNKIFLYEY